MRAVRVSSHMPFDRVNRRLEVDYEGEAAHAAAAPHRGRNALDAAVLGYVNVAALRQHIRPTERVHGIFTHGGDKPNIVPKNMPGAGSFLAVNTIFNVSPKDGAVIGIGAPTMALDEKLGTQGVRFRTAELNWIGRIDSLINIVFTWHTSPVKTFADSSRLYSPAMARFMLLMIVELKLPSFSNCSAQ
jgi:hypothetical protein